MLNTVLRLVLLSTIGIMLDNYDQILSYHLSNVVYSAASSRVYSVLIGISSLLILRIRSETAKLMCFFFAL